MAASELQAGSRLLSRNIDYNTFGVLNAREAFLVEHPEVVRTVVAQYERARAWILSHPAEAAQILAEAARLTPEVATRQLTERTVLDRDVGVPGEKLRAALAAVVPILRSEKLVSAEANPEKALSELLAPGPAQEARR
jgi:sulfonate transport system substrate-binding protein